MNEKNYENISHEYKLIELIYGDRSLKNNIKESLIFLNCIKKPIFNFIQKNNISYIFGETTYAAEILINRFVNNYKNLNCKFYNPHTVRIPRGRFSFFCDEFQTEIVERKNINSNAEEILINFKIEKPDYFSINTSLLKESTTITKKIQKISNFVFNRKFDKNDPGPNGLSRTIRAKTRIKEEFNKETYKLTKKHNLSEFINRKYVYVALHKQPEASIDVIGIYYENQLQNIINIWRVIPDDHLLLIKEHPNAIGDRSIFFYDKISKLENVFFLNEYEDSANIILSSVATFTVSGTVAYEASLYGKKSFTFAPTFFNKIENCQNISIDLFRAKKNFTEITQINNENKMNKNDFLKYVYQNSYKGIIGDPITNIKTINQDNIENVSKAFMELISEQSI
jgi:hypothetical protein